jgi:hypothetical protein
MMFAVVIAKLIFFDLNEMVSLPTIRLPDASRAEILPRFSGVRYQTPSNARREERVFPPLPGEDARPGVEELGVAAELPGDMNPNRRSRSAPRNTAQANDPLTMHLPHSQRRIPRIILPARDVTGLAGCFSRWLNGGSEAEQSTLNHLRGVGALVEGEVRAAHLSPLCSILSRVFF